MSSIDLQKHQQFIIIHLRVKEKHLRTDFLDVLIYNVILHSNLWAMTLLGENGFVYKM